MRGRCWLLVIGVVSGSPTGAGAQPADEAEPGQLAEIQVLAVHPSDVTAFERAVGDVVAVAEAAGLESAFGWHTWTDVFQYTVVSLHESFAEFDDPDAWMRQFAGTDHETAAQAAMASFESLKISALSRDVIEAESAWSYAPDTMIDQAGGAEIIEVWIAPGKLSAFNEVTERAIAFHGRIGYPYAITGYSTHFGDTSRMAFVVPFDDLSVYVGSNRVEAMAEAQGLASEWAKIIDEFRQVTDDVRRSFRTYRPDLSFGGAESAVSDAGGT